MSGTEIDITSDRNPLKFWGYIAGALVVFSGGSGGVSYTMAQQATRATAEATAKEVVESFETVAGAKMERLGERVDANSKAFTGVAKDVEWIRAAIDRIERRQYRDREQ